MNISHLDLYDDLRNMKVYTRVLNEFWKKATDTFSFIYVAYKKGLTGFKFCYLFDFIPQFFGAMLPLISYSIFLLCLCWHQFFNFPTFMC